MRYSIKITVFLLKNPKIFNDFLCPTPEMKARDAYVPFLVFKPINKVKVQEYFAKHLRESMEFPNDRLAAA